MKRTEIVSKIESRGIIAVIRLNSADKLSAIIDALITGGINALEITMTTPNAVEIIRETAGRVGEQFLIGAGTVLSCADAEAVIRAGAAFVVSPVSNPNLIKTCHAHDVPCFPGAFSPTEILQAWDAGADVVKVFPATALGPKYFKDIHGPLPQIKLTPTGGVCLDNAAEFIRSGAVFLGVGTSLLDKELIVRSDWEGLSKRARAFVTAVQTGRAQRIN